MFLDDVGPPDLKRKRGGPPATETTPISKQDDQNCSGYETARPSFAKISIFQPSAQAQLANFIPPEISPDPYQGYGYGAGRAVRGDSSRPTFSWAKINWRIFEPSPAKPPSLDNWFLHVTFVR